MAISRDSNGNMNVAIVKNSFAGNRTESPGQGIGIDRSAGPALLECGGLKDSLSGLKCTLADSAEVTLTSEEDSERGTWEKFGYSTGRLGRLVADSRQRGYFTIGLLASRSSLIGMLAGLQRSGGPRPLRVGLVWISSQASYNTPETTGSGLLGEMSVAVAAGLCLNRIRLRAGLDPPLPSRYIVMVGLKDIDPFERDLIDRTEIEFLSADDVTNCSGNIDCQLLRLSELTDVIYIQADMDVMDPAEVPGVEFPAPGGPTSEQLGAALKAMFRHEKTAAFGINTAPVESKSRALGAACRLIEGAVQGVLGR